MQKWSNNKQRTITAWKWNLTDQLIAQLINLVTNIILFRLLTPEDFGLFVIPFVVVSFVRILQDFGFTSLVVRSNELSPRDISSIFWMVSGLGFIFSALVYFFSPVVSLWTQEVSTAEINQYMALSVIFTGLYAVQEAIIRKNLDFQKLFIVNSFAGTLSSIIAIAGAWYGMGFHSLTLKYVLLAFFLMVGFLYHSTWKPQLAFHKDSLKKNLHYHLPISAEQVLNFAQRNIDNVLISRFLGTISMGLYDRAYRILMLPLQQISGSFAKVLLPAFSQIQEDRKKIGRYYLMVCRFVALVSFPLMLGIFSVAPIFVRVVFGNQWQDIVPLVAVFSILGLFQSIGTLSGAIFQATGDTSLMFRLSLFSKTIMLLAIAFGVFYYEDILAVALCYMTASLIAFIPETYYLCKSIKLKSKDFFLNLLPYASGAVVMMIAIRTMLSFVSIPVNDILLLTSAAFTGVFTYLSFLFIIKNNTLSEAWMLLLNKR